jgi:uncharacterized protein (DUF58 family)
VKRWFRRLAGKIPTRITKSGWWFIGVTTLTSSAAYQSGSNVLFLALACFLSALLLNGLVSWWNYSRLVPLPIEPVRMQTGRSGVIGIGFEDRKTTLHSIGMEGSLLIVLHNGETKHYRTPFLRSGSRQEASFHWTPSKRGIHRIIFRSIDSHFPFGFIRKQMPVGLSAGLIVWPASVPPPPYQEDLHQTDQANLNNRKSTEISHEIGSIRPFMTGDSKKIIYWKKSAQTGELVSKNYDPGQAANSTTYWFDFHESHFATEADVDLLCAKIGSFSQALLKKGVVHRIILHNNPPRKINSRTDWTHLMDDLSTVQTTKTILPPTDAPGRVFPQFQWEPQS